MKFFCSSCFHKIFFVVIAPLLIIYALFFGGVDFQYPNRAFDIVLGFLIAINFMGVCVIIFRKIVTVRPRYDGKNGTRSTDKQSRSA